jgi:hypothetical protein
MIHQKPIDDAPGGFGICFRPRHCGGPQDAIEPVNRKKNRNPIHKKMKHFFYFKMSEL